MFRLAPLLAFVITSACCEIALGEVPATQPAKRAETATVVDSSGATTEITDLSYYDDYADCRGAGGSVILQTKTFKISVDLSRLISIEVRRNEVEVKYIWGSKEKTATGFLAPTGIAHPYVLGGRTATGNFSLPADMLKQLKVHEAPVPNKGEDEYDGKTPIDATLVLQDGQKARVGGLKRSYFARDPNRPPFFVAGQQLSPPLTRHETADIPVTRGGSKATVEFKFLRSIEFTDTGEFTVAMKDGEKATGTLGNDIESDLIIESFKGRCEEYGGFQIVPKRVKAIVFDPGSAH